MPHQLKARPAARLDHFLQEQLPQYSRARLQSWVKAGRVLVNGAPAKMSAPLRGGESIVVDPAALPPLQAEAEDLPLAVLYVDESILAIDKPAGMVVHAGAGVHSGTVVNALLHHFDRLSQVAGEQRPGIVHRLDKETSGVLLVARTDAAHRDLAAQFAERQVEKIYLALVKGRLARISGTVEKPIARDPVHRTRMTARLITGRSAYTAYTVEKQYTDCTLLRVRIGTGRTHQIRVHLASIGHPVVGDKLYGGPPAPGLDRFFLHAHQITFVSPATRERVTVAAALPPELQAYLAALS